EEAIDEEYFPPSRGVLGNIRMRKRSRTLGDLPPKVRRRAPRRYGLRPRHLYKEGGQSLTESGKRHQGKRALGGRQGPATPSPDVPDGSRNGLEEGRGVFVLSPEQVAHQQAKQTRN